MKIAVIGDIHLHEFKDFSKEVLVEWDEGLKKYEQTEGGMPINSRLLNGLDALCEVRENCKGKDVDLLMIAGDLFHKRGSVSTVVYNTAHKVLESFKEDGIPVVAIAGNHDQVSNEDIPEHSLYGFKNLMKVVGEPEVVVPSDIWDGLDESVSILAVPFSKKKQQVIEAIQSYEFEEGKSHVLLAHLGINGAFVGKTNYANKDEYSTNDLRYGEFKYIAIGHYHKPQLLEDNTFYTGALLQHNFNDEGEDRGMWILDTDKRNMKEFIPVNSPKFVTLNKDSLKEYEGSGDFVRIKVTSKEMEDLVASGELDDLGEVRTEVEKDYESDNRIGISISMSFDEIVEKYAQEFNPDAKDIGLELLKRVQH